ncbi:MAG: hypothetical protein HOQ05_12770, partial [Corynebacteriales bacterium]|nr:hypothetical protein [Mycobacteriales bacterium]
AQTPERRKEAARLSSIETAQSLGFDGEYLDGFTGETHHDYQLLEFLEELAEARATKSDSLFAIQYREARIAEFIAAENDRSPALRVLSALDSAEEALHQAVSGGMTGTQLTFKQVQLMAAAEPDNPRWLRIQDQLLNQMGAEFILAKHREQNAPQDVIEYDEARLAALTHPKDHALRKRADELYAALAEKYPFPTTSNENPHRERSEAPPASSPAPTSVSPVPRRRWNLLGRHSARKPR